MEGGGVVLGSPTSTALPPPPGPAAAWASVSLALLLHAPENSALLFFFQNGL